MRIALQDVARVQIVGLEHERARRHEISRRGPELGAVFVDQILANRKSRGLREIPDPVPHRSSEGHLNRRVVQRLHSDLGKIGFAVLEVILRPDDIEQEIAVAGGRQRSDQASPAIDEILRDERFSVRPFGVRVGGKMCSSCRPRPTIQFLASTARRLVIGADFDQALVKIVDDELVDPASGKIPVQRGGFSREVAA